MSAFVLVSHKDVMDDVQMEKISRCLDLNVFLLKISAAWPGDISASRWKNLLYKCCIIFLGSVVTFCVFGMIMYCFTVYDNLDHVIENAIVLVEIVNLSGRAFSYNVYNKKLYFLIESLPRNFFVRTAYHTNAMQITSTISTINHMNMISLGIPVLYMGTAAAMALHPLIIPTEENGYNSSHSAQIHIPFKTWYPFTEDNSYYEIQYICQMISAVFVSIYNAATDALSIALIAYLGFQFQLLSDTLRNMSDNVVFKSKTDTDDRNSSSEKLGESAENILSAEQVLISKTGNVSLREVQEHLQRSEYGAEKNTGCSIETVLEESITDTIQHNTDAEMLEYLKSCIRHHQLLLE